MIAVLFGGAGIVVAHKITVNAAAGIILISHILECVRRKGLQIRQCQCNCRIRQPVCFCILAVICTCMQQFLAQILIRYCIFQHLTSAAGDTTGIGIPLVFLVCGAAEILGINVDTQPRQLRIQIITNSGSRTGNCILKVIGAQNNACEMVVVYRI